MFKMFWLDETIHDLFLDCLKIDLPNHIQTLYNKFFYEKLNYEQFLDTCPKRLEYYTDKSKNETITIHNDENILNFDIKKTKLFKELNYLLIEQEKYKQQYNQY